MLHRNNTYAEIRCKADPAQVWGEQPSAGRVNLSPDIDEVGESSTKGEDVDCGGNGFTEAKVERSPHKVQGKLNSVESRSVLGRLSLGSTRNVWHCHTLARATVLGLAELAPMVYAR
jgi:hypothetical protein